MSTTEQPAPEIGTREWYQTRPPAAATRGSLKFDGTHVWSDGHGITHGLLYLGAVDLTFHNPQQARDLIGYVALLAGEMDAEIARQRPPVLDEPEHERACPRCGSTTAPKATDSDNCWNLNQCADRAAKAGAR